MNRFTDIRRYLALGFLALAFSTEGRACGSEISDHNYYMFSVFNRHQTAPSYLNDISAYWRAYTGTKDDDELDYYKYNKEDVMKTAKGKKDTEMQLYLRRLNAYIAACEKLSPNAWEYPTKQEKLNAQRMLTTLANATALYKGSKLKNQYALLQMRLNMMRGLHEQNVNYWNNTASKLPQTMWREAMKNIYARALWKTGKHQQGLDIYAEQGDMESIKALARNYRNLAGIQSIYLKNPNSQMLTYLVQDFVNNSQQTKDWQEKDELDKDEMQRIGAKVIYKKEALDFITFADKVIAEGKTPTPCLWRSATAMLHYLYGNHQKALKDSKEACTLDGTGRMKDNARAIRLLALAKTYQGKDKESAQLVEEFKWLYGKVKEDSNGEDLYDNHYVEVQERIIYRALHDTFLRLSKESKGKKSQEYQNMTNALHGMMDGYERDFSKGKTQEKYIDKYIYSSEYFVHLDSLSAQQLASYFEFLTSQHYDAFEQYVCQMLYRNADFFKDLIGTKYLAEGNFGEAANWLKDVPMSFINNQAISFYAGKRNYSQPFWFHRQKVNDEDVWSLENNYAQMKENPKLKFCQEMAQLIGQHNVSREGEAKEKLAYELAVRYYQASCYGDCWYLAHYGKSVDDSARVGEADFANIAIGYLKESKQSKDLKLRYHSLYALASIGIEPWYTTAYDENYNEKTLVQHQSAQYQAMQEWSRFRHEHPEAVDTYTTRCDILKQFEKTTRLSN